MTESKSPTGTNKDDLVKGTGLWLWAVVLGQCFDKVCVGIGGETVWLKTTAFDTAHALAGPTPSEQACQAALSRLQGELEEARDQNAFLTDRVTELEDVPWPKWANTIHDRLVEVGACEPNEQVDLAQVFDEWCEDFETAASERAEKAEAKAAQLQSDNASLRSALGEKDGALKPFAEQAAEYDEDGYPDSQTDWPSFTIGDFRRARQALKGGANE